MKRLVLVMMSLLLLATVTSTYASGTTESEKGKAQPTVAAGKTKISVLRPGDEVKVAAFMKPAIDEFMKANPDIEVEAIYESWGGWIQKFPTLFAANTQPDVIFWWDNKQNDLSAKPRLVALDKYVDASVFKAIPQSIWDLVSVSPNAKYYIPSSVDSFALYYNKDVFKQAGLDPAKPPRTWDDLLAAAKAIKEKTGLPGIGVPGKYGMEVLQEFVAHFLYQALGTDLLDANNKPIFNNEKGLQAMKFLETLWPYTEPSQTDYGRGELRPLLRDGKLGMLIDGPWAIPAYTQKYGENLDDSPIGIAEPPLGPNNKKITWAGTNGWIATRESTAKASGKLISFLMSDEQLFKHHAAYGSIPLLPSELTKQFYGYKYWQTLNKINNEYKLLGMIGKYHPTPAAFYAEMEPAWQLSMFGKNDAKTVMDMAEKRVEDINARRGIK